MLPVEELTLIAALCDKIGMPWEINPRRNRAEHPWNGRSLNLAHHNPSGTSDLVHDVAHWLVAPPRTRRDRYFQLDTMAYFEEGSTARNHEEEEETASLLGILVERALGLNWRYTWCFHSWGREGWRDLRPKIRGLRRRGLVIGLMPSCLL
jgi:hypothetical protein